MSEWAKQGLRVSGVSINKPQAVLNPGLRPKTKPLKSLTLNEALAPTSFIPLLDT